MDPVWIAVAFVCGLAVRQVGLPPLVGFLAAGFVLEALGAKGGAVIEQIAHLGVLLLLFSIGLKLRPQSLLQPEVWAGASIHMLTTVAVFGAGLYGLAVGGFGIFSDLDLKLAVLVAFALSFSSTVFAVKVLEAKGEMASLHGRVSIGILIMQDVIAILFLTASTAKLPSVWALALLGLWPLRRLLMAVMDRTGHGELLILYGLLLALGGAYVFEVVDMKPDLGALILGVLVAGHPKAGELAKSLLSFKDIFLIGFFLSIGLSGVPSLEGVGVAALLILLVPFKVLLFFVLLTRFKLRARTSLLSSFSLANYSEFGLIVGAEGVALGWLGNEWLTVIAIAISMSFVLASPINTAANALYLRFHDALVGYETKVRHPDDRPIDVGDVELVIFGMGPVGAAAYDFMRERYGDTVVGIDADSVTVQEQRAAGRRVVLGDATDPDLYARVSHPEKIQVVMLAMQSHAENLLAARQISQLGYAGVLAATAQFSDEVTALREAGVHAAFNFYAEAGTGFAEHVHEHLEDAKAV